MLDKPITVEVFKELRPNLEVHDISGWSKDEWLAFRMRGLGASEIGTMMGVNNFEEPAILWAKKLGIIPSGVSDNIAMLMGRLLEKPVSEMWEYYDVEAANWETMAANVEAKKKVRLLYKPEMYVVNPKYPWLFASCDGLFYKGNDIAGTEIKTISGFAAEKYIGGVPISYVYQIYTYMIVFEVDYWEIALLKDGRNFEVIPFERNENIVNTIIESSKEFWENVIQSREALSNDDRATLDSLEPMPTDTEVYESYLHERFRSSHKSTSKEATPGIIKSVIAYDKWRTKAAEIEAKKLLHSNKIKRFLAESEELIGVDGFTVNWREGARGRNFRVTPKKDKDE